MKINLRTERCIPDIFLLDIAKTERKAFTFKSLSAEKKLDRDAYLLDFLRRNAPVDRDFIDLKKLEREHGRCTVLRAKEHILANLAQFSEVKERFFSRLLEEDYATKNEDFNRLKKHNKAYSILKVMANFNEHLKEAKIAVTKKSLESILRLDMISLRLNSFLKSGKCKICALKVPVWQFKNHDENCYQYNTSKDSIILINDKLLECIREIKREADVFDYKQLISTKKQLLQENYKKMKSESLKNSLNKTFYGSFSGKKSESASVNMNSYLFANKTTYENHSNNKSRFFNYKRKTNESLNKYQNESWGDINNKVQSNSVRPSIDLENKKIYPSPDINIFGTFDANKDARDKQKSVLNKGGNLFNMGKSKSSSDSENSDADESSGDQGGLLGDRFKSMDDSDEESKTGNKSQGQSKKFSNPRNISNQFNSSNNLKSSPEPFNTNINTFNCNISEAMKSPVNAKQHEELFGQNLKIDTPDHGIIRNQTSITNIVSPLRKIEAFADEDTQKPGKSGLSPEDVEMHLNLKAVENTLSLNKFRTSSSQFKTQHELEMSHAHDQEINKKRSYDRFNMKQSETCSYREDKTNALIKLDTIIRIVMDKYSRYFFDALPYKDISDRIIEVTSEYKSSKSSNSDADSESNSASGGLLLGDRFVSMDDDEEDENSKEDKVKDNILWPDSPHADDGKANNFINKSTIIESTNTNKNMLEPKFGFGFYDSDGGAKEKQENIIDQIDSPFTGSKDTRVDKKDTSMVLDTIKCEKKGWLNHGSKKLLNNVFSTDAYKKYMKPQNFEYNPKTNEFDLASGKNGNKLANKPQVEPKKDLYSQMNMTYYVNPKQQTINKTQIWNFMSKASKTEYHKTTVVNEVDEQYYFYLFNKDIIKYKEHLLTNPYVQNFFYDQEFLVNFEAYENKLKSQNKKKLLLKLKALVEKRISKAKRMLKFSNNIETLQSQVKERRLLKEAISRSFGNFSVLEESVSKTNDKISRREKATHNLKNELLEKSLLNSIKRDIDTKNLKHVHQEKVPLTDDNSSIKINKKFRKLKRTLSDSEFVAINTKEKMYEEKTKVVDISDFIVLKELGAGAFGKVFLVKHKTSGEFYAMKVLKLSAQHDDKYINALLNEIKILNMLSSDFLVKAYFSFMHNNSLCIVMEYMIGGDVRGLLNEWGILDNDTTRYYAAQLILAVDSLHMKKVIHRDLKPENLLLNNKGQLKLADFGLSEIHRKIQNTENKSVSEQEITDNEDRYGSFLVEKNPETDADVLKKSVKNIKVVGTPDYIAPEILFPPPGFEEVCDKYCEAVDWWAVGCLIYEFIVGISAFGAMTLEEVFANIKNKNIEWPDIGYGEDKMTPEAKNLIDMFLDPDPATRLGNLGVEAIKSHKFFEGIEWSKLHKMNSPLNIDLKPDFKKCNIKGSFRLSTLIPSKVKHSDKISSTYNKFKMNRVDLLHDFNVEYYHSLK